MKNLKSLDSFLDEARSWGTFGTPEAKKVTKQMDKAWDKFSKAVSKAHADFRSQVKSIINSEDGSKSGIVDSEGEAYITSMVNNFVRKEFMMSDLGDISRRKYMNDLYESNELTEAKRGTIHRAVKKGDYPATIVVLKDNKVIHQETVSTPEAVPAAFNVLQKEYPGAKLHVEDKGGHVLFTESEELTEASAAEKIAQDIMVDLTEEHGEDALMHMSKTDAYETVHAYGIKGAMAGKVTKALMAMIGESVQFVDISESKKSEALAKAIDSAMIKIDDSMSYEDFALAIGAILKDEYGQHTFKDFMKVLHKDLGM